MTNVFELFNREFNNCVRRLHFPIDDFEMEFQRAPIESITYDGLAGKVRVRRKSTDIEKFYDSVSGIGLGFGLGRGWIADFESDLLQGVFGRNG